MRSNISNRNARNSEFYSSTAASSLIKQMTTYMPALTPVNIRPRNTSRLLIAATPQDENLTRNVLNAADPTSVLSQKTSPRKPGDSI